MQGIKNWVVEYTKSWTFKKEQDEKGIKFVLDSQRERKRESWVKVRLCIMKKLKKKKNYK